jgi:hypothetical protein
MPWIWDSFQELLVRHGWKNRQFRTNVDSGRIVMELAALATGETADPRALIKTIIALCSQTGDYVSSVAAVVGLYPGELPPDLAKVLQTHSWAVDRFARGFDRRAIVKDLVALLGSWDGPLDDDPEVQATLAVSAETQATEKYTDLMGLIAGLRAVFGSKEYSEATSAACYLIRNHPGIVGESPGLANTLRRYSWTASENGGQFNSEVDPTAILKDLDTLERQETERLAAEKALAAQNLQEAQEALAAEEALAAMETFVVGLIDIGNNSAHSDFNGRAVELVRKHGFHSLDKTLQRVLVRHSWDPVIRGFHTGVDRAAMILDLEAALRTARSPYRVDAFGRGQGNGPALVQVTTIQEEEARAAPPPSKRKYIIVLDNSISMERRTKVALDAAIAQCNALGLDFILVVFADGATVVSPHARLPGQGSTNITAGIEKALHLAKDDPSYDYVLLLLTDGGHNVGPHPRTKTMAWTEFIAANDLALVVLTCGIGNPDVPLSSALQGLSTRDIEIKGDRFPYHPGDSVEGVSNMLKDCILAAESSWGIATTINLGEGRFFASPSSAKTMIGTTLTFVVDGGLGDTVWVNGKETRVNDHPHTFGSLGQTIDMACALLRAMRLQGGNIGPDAARLKQMIADTEKLIAEQAKHVDASAGNPFSLEGRYRQLKRLRGYGVDLATLRNQVDDLVRTFASTAASQAEFLNGRAGKFAAKALKRAPDAAGYQVKESAKAIVTGSAEAGADGGTVSFISQLSHTDLRDDWRDVVGGEFEPETPLEWLMLLSFMGVCVRWNDEPVRSAAQMDPWMQRPFTDGSNGQPSVDPAVADTASVLLALKQKQAIRTPGGMDTHVMVVPLLFPGHDDGFWANALGPRSTPAKILFSVISAHDENMPHGEQAPATWAHLALAVSSDLGLTTRGVELLFQICYTTRRCRSAGTHQRFETVLDMWEANTLKPDDHYKHPLQAVFAYMVASKRKWTLDNITTERILVHVLAFDIRLRLRGQHNTTDDNVTRQAAIDLLKRFFGVTPETSPSPAEVPEAEAEDEGEHVAPPLSLEEVHQRAEELRTQCTRDDSALAALLGGASVEEYARSTLGPYITLLLFARRMPKDWCRTIQANHAIPPEMIAGARYDDLRSEIELYVANVANGLGRERVAHALRYHADLDQINVNPPSKCKLIQELQVQEYDKKVEREHRRVQAMLSANRVSTIEAGSLHRALQALTFPNDNHSHHFDRSEYWDIVRATLSGPHWKRKLLGFLAVGNIDATSAFVGDGSYRSKKQRPKIVLPDGVRYTTKEALLDDLNAAARAVDANKFPTTAKLLVKAQTAVFVAHLVHIYAGEAHRAVDWIGQRGFDALPEWLKHVLLRHSWDPATNAFKKDVDNAEIIGDLKAHTFVMPLVDIYTANRDADTANREAAKSILGFDRDDYDTLPESHRERFDAQPKWVQQVLCAHSWDPASGAFKKEVDNLGIVRDLAGRWGGH